TTVGIKSGQVSLFSNDGDENPFDFAITGVVVALDDYAANTATTGVATPGGGQVLGIINALGDRDWFKVPVVQGLTYVVDMVSGSPPQPAPFLEDTQLYLYDSSGQFLTVNTVFIGGDSQLTFTAAYTGNYFVGAAAYDDTAAATYRLSVSAGASPEIAV